MLDKIKEYIKDHYSLLCCISIIIVILVALFFGFKKQGFYIDEYYVYTFANGTQLGMDIDVGEWNDTSPYVEQLISSGEENFRFSRVYKNVELYGVHPILYYYLIHFASSIISGVFSKWIGISVNICILIPILFLVKKIAWHISGGNEAVTLLTVLFYGLSPATISMVILVRMYLLLSLWTLLYAYIHVVNLERDHLSIGRFLVPVFLCGFFGFLTQYFFVIVMFFMTFVYAFYLLAFCHRFKDTLIYGFTAFLSLICTYFVWPISYYHIFIGYRGKGAMGQAIDFGGMGNRFVTHLQWMNKMVFGNLIILFIPLLILGIIQILKRFIQIRKLGNKNVLLSLSSTTRAFVFLGIAALLDYLVLTQVALMEGGITCCRQMYTAYALFLLLIPTGIYRLTENLQNRKVQCLALPIMVLPISIVILLGFVTKSVLFVYEDERIATKYAEDHPDSKVIIYQNDDGNYDSRMQEVIMYPKVFFASVNDISSAEDDIIAGADELLVYMSTATDNSGVCFDSIYAQNSKLKQADHLWDSSSGFFSVYLMH